MSAERPTLAREAQGRARLHFDYRDPERSQLGIAYCVNNSLLNVWRQPSKLGRPEMTATGAGGRDHSEASGDQQSADMLALGTLDR